MNQEALRETPAVGPAPARRPVPLYAQVVIGVSVGAALGLGLRAWGQPGDSLGQLGMLVIRLLKALATPVIMFSILDSFLRTRISLRQGGRLLAICLFNVSVAFAIGLVLLNALQPGLAWRGHLAELSRQVGAQEGELKRPGEVTLDPVKNLAGYVPESLLQPFLTNSVITIVLCSVLAGAAMRRLKDRRPHGPVETLERLVEGALETLIQMLEWVIQLVPLAVFGVVASVVARSGLEVFATLWIFLAVMLLGLALHSLVYYPLMAWLVGRKSPRVYLGQGADAILTGLSTNSSLATVPVTLRVLDRMGVSPQSARLSACVGTNLNNDGIMLYEAMAALFLAQAVGFELSFMEQFSVVLSALMAGVGVAGIPEAGLIVLPLVLASAGLPEAVVMQALPLILTVDWIIARARSGVNVMSDLLVAILLDSLRRPDDPDTPVAGEGDLAPEVAAILQPS